MADNIMIAAGVKLDGEADFKKAVEGIAKNQSVLASEMRKVTAEFADNATSQKALTALSDEYNKKIAVQENKVNLLKSALENARKEYGDNSNQVKDWQIKLNNAETQLSQSKTALGKLDTELNKSDTAFESAGKSAIGFGDILKANLLSDAIMSGIRSLGSALSGAFRDFTEFAKEGIKTASDLTEVQNVVDTVFGASTETIDKFSKTAATSFGLSELSAKQFTGTMGAMLSSMGLSNSAVTDMSTSLAGLSGDMASFYNLDPTEAFEKLRSGISGETEPLKQLGINLSVANLEAYALSEGITTAYSSMTESEKATLRYNYIMQATANAQGDFAKTSDSYANQQRILALQMENLGAAIGTALLPQINELTKATNDLLSGAIDADEFGKRIGDTLSGLVSTIAAKVPDILRAGTEIAQSLITGVMSQLPEMADGAFQVVDEFVTSLLKMSPNILLAGVDIITNLLNGIAQSLPEIIPVASTAIAQFVKGLADRLPDILQAGLNIVLGLAQGIWEAEPEIIKTLPDLIDKITEFIIGAIPQIISAGAKLFSTLCDDVPTILQAWSEAIPKIIDDLVGLLVSDENKEKMGDAGVELFASLLNVGKIVDALSKFIPNVIKGIIESITGKTLEEMLGSTGAAVANNIISYSSGFGLSSLIDNFTGKSNNSSAGANAETGTSATTPSSETGSNPAPVKDDTAIENSKQTADTLIAEYAANTEKTNAAIEGATDAITSLSDTITSATSSAGITLEDTVDEAAQKIVDQIESQTEMQALIAEAQARAQQMMNGTPDTTSLATYSEDLGKYLNSGEGYIKETNGNKIYWIGGENNGKSGNINKDKSITWDKSDEPTTSPGTGYIKNLETGQLYWIGVDDVASRQGVTANAENKVANIINNYSVTADLSKVKDLAGLIKAVDEAEQAQKAGYVE